MKFATATGRSIFNAVFNPPKVNVSELYLPRRTAFVYELEDDEYGSDIPTTLRRSKLDCPPVRTTDNPNLTCNPYVFMTEVRSHSVLGSCKCAIVDLCTRHLYTNCGC